MKQSNTMERLALLMEQRNLRQVDILNLVEPIAKKYNAKFNKSDISQYLSGKTEPNQNKLLILGEALNVSPAWLMGYDSDDNPAPSKNISSANDEKDIARTMSRLKEQLMNEQGLMFDGELLDDETIQLVLEEIERQERLIKTINKKYIPKKYRK